ncbi:mitochondrial carrier [Penicillium angulare]|uniref:mitochondrial carrier n=1 Tax=Penicillium angulare TaxID=116970 RepID=UPI0025404C1B|nr:mitochondrial carrier [Penicillium angulare]KAJ5281956.1 mitochondrial carrier [Penicillium angulare]
MSPRKQVSSWQSILAGAAAGGFESLITYSTEYLKTYQQLSRAGSINRQSLIQLLASTTHQQEIGTLYTGAGAFCVSNASKSSICFFPFDTVRQFMLIDQTGKVATLGNMCAGLMAGVAEAVVVVTPDETIKTKRIDDRAGPKLYRSTIYGIVSIFRKEGLPGLYRGVTL